MSQTSTGVARAVRRSMNYRQREWLLGYALVLPVIRMIGEAGEHRYLAGDTVFNATISNLGWAHKWIVHPHGEVSQEDLAEILELALEGRRRVKEQLKKMGSFEYYHTSFSYTLNDTGEERFVGVPEQGGRNLISADPLAPGSIYTATVAPDGTVWFGMLRTHSLGHLQHGIVKTLRLPRADARPYGVAIDAAGNVWYTDISGWLGMLPADHARSH